MSIPRILFIAKQKQGKSLWVDPANRKPGLANAIDSLVDALCAAGFDAHSCDVTDRNAVNAVVTQYKPDIVVIEAYWVTPGKLQLLKFLHPKIHWIVRNHSEVPFLAEEGNAGAWNCEYLKMGVEISCNSQRCVNDLSPLLFNLDVDTALLTHLPNIYLNEKEKDVKPKSISDTEIHVGCFGAVRVLKNHVLQAMGAINYANATGKKLFFHINGQRTEGGGSQPLEFLRGMFNRLHNCELIEHPWMDKTTFYTLMKERIDVVVQCSLTESFNIVAADAVYCGVPVIASSEIRWLNKRSHVSAVDSDSLASKLNDLFGRNYRYLAAYAQDQVDDINTYNTQSLNIWKHRFLPS